MFQVIAIHNAIKRTWQEGSILGCRFHLSQAWWRKMQELGLSQDLAELAPPEYNDRLVKYVDHLMFRLVPHIHPGFGQVLLRIVFWVAFLPGWARHLT
jgi:hypothetical protein